MCNGCAYVELYQIVRGATSRGKGQIVPRTMSSVFVWFCVEVGGVSGAGAAASHLAALDPISLALLAPQVTIADTAPLPASLTTCLVLLNSFLYYPFIPQNYPDKR